jgi:hypothetical protein
MTSVAEIRKDSKQRSFDAELSRIHALVTRLDPAAVEPASEEPPPVLGDDLTTLEPLQRLGNYFGLTAFERDLLLLCAGVELRSEIANACASAQKDARARSATFGLALAALPDAHWSAISPDRPLRYWRLLEVGAGDTLPSSPLRIDERILHFLTGVACTDARLAAFVRPVPITAASLAAAQADCAAAVARYWTQASTEAGVLKPVLLVGRSSFDQSAIVQHASQHLGWQLSSVRLDDIPGDAADRAQFARLWNREALLACSALYIRTGGADGTESLRPLLALLDQLQVPVAVEVREGSAFERIDGLRLGVPALNQQESRKVWLESLGPLAERLNGGVDRIVEQFKFDGAAIRFASGLARNASEANGDSNFNSLTWEICRSHARRSLEHLAVRIEPKARWQDLVLPESRIEILRQIAVHVRQRSVVNTRWGFAERYSRGLGATALFAGSSGTGKTMAAEVIAAELELDLYQIDLASVVSKYIGETEKNLRRIFDAAEESGAVLLFDEADALFGKRSEVKDSHDRYANIEISYLLQRMEAYNGLAILTTNMKQALDDAFLRRIRFIMQFPFPDLSERRRIWERVFPEKTPVRDLDCGSLAQLNVPGGVIRNIATHAAFLAAEEGDAVTMGHILRAARVEYAKLERPLTTAETGGWA